MRQGIILLAVSILYFQTLRSQDDNASQLAIYKIVVYVKGSPPSSGFLKTITDSSLYLSSTAVHLQFNDEAPEGLQKFDYRNLLKVKIHKKNAFGKAILFGAAAGLVLGVKTGTWIYQANQIAVPQPLNPPNQTGLLLTGGVLGATLGGFTGMVAGTFSTKKFYINGEWKNLAEMKQYMQHR
jgi:hypothetical protein